jgi:hypothetical protein
LSLVIVPSGPGQPVPFSELEMGKAFLYDGHLLLKCQKLVTSTGHPDAVRLSDGKVYLIPDADLVTPRVALVSTLGDK